MHAVISVECGYIKVYMSLGFKYWAIFLQKSKY